MKNNMKITPLLLIVALLSMMACSQPNLEGRIPIIEYDGESKTALINHTNARPLLSMTFDHIQTSFALSSIIQLLSEEQIDNTTTGDQRHIGTLIGDCSSFANGSVDYNFDVKSNGELTGSLVFDTFCVREIVINGSVNVTGIYSTAFSPSYYRSMYWDLPFVRITNGPNRMDTSGTFSSLPTPSNEAINTLTVNLRMRDQYNNSYASEDLVVFHTPASNSSTSVDEIQVSDGKFYHSLYGFAHVTSYIGHLKTSPGDILPHEGGLKVSGTRGFAYIEVNNKDDFNYFVDIDGDQAAEDQYFNIPWTEFYQSWYQYRP